MDNIAVDGFRMRHLSHRFRSNSLHLEKKNHVSIDDPTRTWGREGEYDGTKKKETMR